MSQERGARAPEIAVVVATYKRPQLLERMVAALEAQTLERDRFEVVIVDNGSGDDTTAVLNALAARTSLALRPLALETNRGPAAARNAGWRASTAPLIACTDDDCVPEPDWLAAGVDVLCSDPGIGVVQGRTEKPADADTYPYTDWTIYRQIRSSTPWFEGCNLFFRREALEAVGGFDEEIGWYGEETALGWGVLARGWTRAFASRAVVRHDLVERGWRYHMQQRYLERNVAWTLSRFPAMRADIWRPWAHHSNDAKFALALIGVLMGWRFPPALALALPYWRVRRPDRGHPRALRLFAERVAVDTAGFAGHLVGSVRHRYLLI